MHTHTFGVRDAVTFTPSVYMNNPIGLILEQGKYSD